MDAGPINRTDADAADAEEAASQPFWKRVPPRTLGIGAAIAAVALVGGYAVLSHGGGERAEPAVVDQLQAVSVVPVAPASFQPTVLLNGEIRPHEDVRVYAPASGVRILRLLADEGDVVERGQPLAQLDTALAEAQLAAAQASVAEAVSAATRARSEYERAESIRDSGALSAEAIAQRETAAAAADARLAAARAQLAEVQARLQGGYVRAPIGGVILERTAQLGAPVDNQVLFRIAGDGRLEAAVSVAEADILALPRDARATFRLVDGTTVRGRLQRLPASIDTRTRTGEAVFDLPRDPRLRAGMYVRGEAILSTREALAAPAASVLYQDGEAYVYVIGEDNVAERRDVRVGVRSGEQIEIVEGVTAGERVAAGGAAFLQPGERIEPVEATADQAGGLRGRQG